MNLFNKIWNNKHIKFLLIAFLCSMPILFYQDIPVSHDILFHLSRIKGISYELECGNFFSLIYHNFLNNLGYASPLFYADIFLYPLAFIYKIFNLSITYKIMILLINLVTIYVIDYILAKIIKNKSNKKIFFILYLFSSYRMTDLYIRGAIGECLAFIFIPFVILGLEELVYGNKKKFYYLIIGMIGLIYSHVISTFIVGIFILFYLVLNIRKILSEKRYLYLLLSIVITFLLTCNFLLPLIEQMLDRNFYIHHLTNYDKFDNINVPLYKLFFEVPLPSKIWLPLGIGIIYLYFIILGFKYRKKLDYKSLVYLILGLIFLLLSTNLVPSVIYQKLLFLIQFQWRFYLLATTSLFFFGIKIIDKVSNNEKKLIEKMVQISSLVLIVITWTNNSIYEKVSVVNGEYLGYYEYLPEGVDYKDVVTNNIKISANNEFEYSYNFDKDKMIIQYSENCYDDSTLTVPLLYYKGYVTDKNYQLVNNNGLVSINLDKESDEFIIYYQGTKIILITRIVTIITILVISVYYIRKKGLYGKFKSCIKIL